MTLDPNVGFVLLLVIGGGLYVFLKKMGTPNIGCTKQHEHFICPHCGKCVFAKRTN